MNLGPRAFLCRKANLVALAAALLLTACSEGPTSNPSTQVPDTRILSISINPRSSPAPTTQDLIDATNLAQSAGARGSVLTARWSTLEPIPRAYSLQDLANGIALLGSQWGFKLMVGIQVINTVPKETPTDLLGVPFNDPQMKARFHALIDALKPALTSQVAYLSIGNEVDVYLAANPDQWSMYKEFLDDAQNYIQQVSPQIRVGTTVTFGGATGPDANQVAQLTSSTDVYILTYYPLGPDFHPSSPQSPLTDLPRMLALAGSRPLVLQEVGYPSSQTLSSSDDQEAQFVSSVFQAWQGAGNQAEFLNYFLLHDFPAPLCDTLSGYYNLPNDANFKAYLCSLGLRRADGTPKAAWQAFVGGARTVR